MLMTNITEKACRKCGDVKPVAEFYRQARGYTSYCKDCMKELSRQRVLDGRDKVSKIKYEEKRGHTRGTVTRTKTGTGRRNLTDIERAAYNLYHNATKRSLYGDIPLEITREDILNLVTEFCANNHHVLTRGKHPFKPSLDRIDSKKGYTPDNIRICWQIENYCKNTYTDVDVVEFCKRKLGLL